MKVLLAAIGAALLVAAAPAARAQTGQPSTRPENGEARRGSRMMQMLFKDIDLTDIQKAQIDSIQAAYRAKMPARTPGAAPDPSTRAARREAMRNEAADIRAVLTPEQQQQFDKNMEAMRDMRRGGPGSE